MLNPYKHLRYLGCLVLLFLSGSLYACNFSTLTLNSETSLGGGLYQYNLTMCSPGGCDGVDIFGTCIGSQMNDNTGNWSIGVGPPATITTFTGNLSSPQTGAVFNGALTSASTFVNYTNATNWWTYETTAIVPSQPICVNLTIVTSGVPSDICVYGLEGADLIFLAPACPQVLGSTCVQPGPLEVEFIDFRADLNDDQVELGWSTAMERRHDKFLIERSPDGGHYTSVGEVKGTGESSTVRQYQFADLNPEPGANHYRIAAVDQDGLAQYTNSIQVLYEPQSFKLDRVYPNPASDHATLEFIATQEEQGRLLAFDIEGRQVIDQELTVDAGRNVIRLETAAWPTGIYTLAITGQQGKLVTKIVRQ